jgi:hypothetical protein
MALNEDDQTEVVFKTRRNQVDPVSGNEVPPGSLPEEVRDDIPAMLSEGEYVVPADVLRYYGMKFFEDLREQAKIGMAEMEANGRIGGEPVEVEGDSGISDEEVAAMILQDLSRTQTGAAQGGLMGFQEGGLSFPEYIKQPDLSQFGYTGLGFGGLEYRVYVNDQGMKITIPFFNGQPMAMIPPGYAPEGQQVKEEVKKVDDSDKGRGKGDPLESDPPDYSNLSNEELEGRIQGLKDKTTTEGKIASFIDSIPIIAGINMLAGTTNTQKQIDMYQAELDSRKSRVDTEPSDTDSKFIVPTDPADIKAMKDAAPRGYTYNPDTGAYETDDTTPDVSPRPPTRPGSGSDSGSKSGSDSGSKSGSDSGSKSGSDSGSKSGSDSGSGDSISDAADSYADLGAANDPFGLLNKGGLMKKKKK